MSVRALARGLVCVAVLAASAATSPTRSAEPEPRYFSTQFGELFQAPIQRIAPGTDGSVYAVGLAYAASKVGDFAITPPEGGAELYVARIAPGGAIVRASRAETRREPDGTWTSSSVRCTEVAPDGSVWVAGFGGIAAVGLQDLGDPSNSPGSDAWVAKFAPDGALAFATNLGGTDDENVNGLALTPEGDAVLVGTTQSLDFPVIGAFQPTHGGGEDDGFVALVRGDGTGVAWSSYLGGSHHDDVNAVAVTAAGEILVASRAFDLSYPYSSRYIRDTDEVESLQSTVLTRLSSDGAVLSATALPFFGSGGVFALAVEPDGRILVGGAGGAGSGSDAQLVRLSDDGRSIEGRWSAGNTVVRQITPMPNGGVFVGTGAEGYGWDITANGGRILAAGLDDTAPPLDVRKFGGSDGCVRQLVMAPDGALCVFAPGEGVPFGDGPRSPWGYRLMFVSRMPLSGGEPPSRLQVVRRGRRWADLEWSGDGDPAAQFEVQITAHPDLRLPIFATYGVRPGGARSVRLTRLRPGERRTVRLISVSPSGVRVLTPDVARFRTAPAPVIGVHAWYVRENGFIVVNIRSDNGSGATIEVEQRTDSGPWIAMRPEQTDGSALFQKLDYTPVRRGARRMYRVRAYAAGVWTDWVESNELRL